MADLNAAEAIYALHQMGWLNSRTDPTVKPRKTAWGGYHTTPPDGRADSSCARNGMAVFIEYKCAADGFVLKKWEDNQREWAATHAIPNGTDYYVWLRLGTAMPHLTKNLMRKRSWLIPYSAMIYIAGLVEAVQGTLPLLLTTNHTHAMRDLKYDAITLFAAYELEWIKPEGKTGRWNIPDGHIFHQQYHTRPAVGVAEYEAAS